MGGEEVVCSWIFFFLKRVMQLWREIFEYTGGVNAWLLTEIFFLEKREAFLLDAHPSNPLH